MKAHVQVHVLQLYVNIYDGLEKHDDWRVMGVFRTRGEATYMAKLSSMKEYRITRCWLKDAQ